MSYYEEVMKQKEEYWKKKYKHGLTIGRYQPLHTGHLALINKMVRRCEKATVVLGSLNMERNERNPFLPAERYEMLYDFYGEDINIIGIGDIGNLEAWPQHVLTTIGEKVDIFYAGSEKDAYPFNKISGLKIKILDRTKIGTPDLPYKVYSGTEIREFLKKENPEWRLHTPNWNLVEKYWKKYQEHLSILSKN